HAYVAEGTASSEWTGGGRSITIVRGSERPNSLNFCICSVCLVTSSFEYPTTSMNKRCAISSVRSVLSSADMCCSGTGAPLLAPIVSNFLALRSSRNQARQAQDRDRESILRPSQKQSENAGSVFRARQH